MKDALVHDLDVWVDRTAGFVEELQASNGTLSRKLTDTQHQVERLNREKHATYRIGKVKALSSEDPTVKEIAVALKVPRATVGRICRP